MIKEFCIMKVSVRFRNNFNRYELVKEAQFDRKRHQKFELLFCFVIIVVELSVTSAGMPIL
jgi:hypothetical protein